MAMPIQYSTAYTPPAGGSSSYSSPDPQPATGARPWYSQPTQQRGFFPAVRNAAGQGRQKIADQTGLDAPPIVSDEMRQALLAQQAAAAAKFAVQGQQGYAAYGQQAQGALDALQRQASGQDSVSQLQLRQALQQQLAQQRSMAAGASPRNAAMAARTAAIQMGRAGTAAAGQQAIAGQQERNQAATQYGSLLGSLRGQDLSAALGARTNAMSGYGAANTGPPQPGPIQLYGPAAAAAIAAFASDRALKTNIQGGDDKANAAMSGLRPYTYAYKDQALGAGPQVGVMAQDLQRAGLGQAVVKTPIGLAVDPGKLSGANTAMIAALNRRVQAIEGQPGPGPGPTVARLGARPGEAPAAALASAFGTDPNARAESMANWARTVGMDPAQVARDAQLQAHLARRVNDYRAASPEEKSGLAQIWGLNQKMDEQRARQNRTPGAR